MKRALVTGGAGFIGSALIRHILMNTEHGVVYVDKLTYAGNLDSLKFIQDNNQNYYAYEQVDICDKNSIKRSIEKIFKVKVSKVNTSIVRGKLKTFKGVTGYKKNYKKAIITLKEGSTIDSSMEIK